MVIGTEVSDSYSNTHFSRCRISSIITKALYNLHVYTACYTGIFPFRNYLYVVDADTIESAIVVANWITDVHKVGYAMIESSPGHYWIIADKVAKTKSLVRSLVRSTPGACGDYVNLVNNRGICFLRVTPKLDKIVHTPKFPETHGLTNKVVVDWYNEFVAYHKSLIYRTIVKHLVMKNAIQTGTVSQMIADPSFMV